MEDTVPLKEVSTHVNALVTRDAAERLEQLITGELFRGDCAGVADKPMIKPTARREE